MSRIEGEGWSDRMARYNFLENITHEECHVTKTNLLTTNASLTECVVALRKRERQIVKEQRDKRILKQTVRRWQEENGVSPTADRDKSIEPPHKKTRRTEKEDQPDQYRNPKFWGELKPSKGGYLKFEPDCWKSMNSDQQSFVKQWNSKIRCQKESEVAIPEGITIARRQRKVEASDADEPGDDKKRESRKRIRFNLDEEEAEE